MGVSRYFRDNPEATGICSTTDDIPVLSITYTSDLGLQSHFDLTPHRLNDRSTLYVNNGDGNAVVSANDLTIRGVGLGLSVARYYNSLSTATSGEFGPGWTMSVGPDVLLKRRGSGTPGSWFDYEAPSGTIFGTFVEKGSTNNYYKPSNGGLNAVLTYDSTSSDYKLTFDGSRMVYWFSGCSTCDQHMVKETDRHGNAITYTYNGSNELTTITDSEGRNLTLTYNTDGTLQKMTDAASRTWQYGYISGVLRTYTDPDNNVTNYDYTSGELSTITDPAGSDSTSDRPTTTLTYTAGQVSTLTYSKDSATGGSDQFAYVYGIVGDSTLSARCSSADHDAYSTDVTDNSDSPFGTTTYCFRYPYLDSDYNYTGLQQQVYDGDGHKRSGSYTADASTMTSADGNANAGGTSSYASTVSTYDPTLTENLDKIVEPADSSGDTGGTTQLSYVDASNPNLPTSVEDSAGHCTAYVYSSGGDITDSYSGMTPPIGSTDCSSQTSGVRNHLDYNSDGTVKDSYNPDGSTSTETTYTYYSSAAGNDGGHAYLDGQLYWVVQPGGTPPSGTAACSTSTSLCTSYTYDQLDRVTSITDGNANTTTLHYDGLDHITEIDLGGASTCNGGHTNCDSYTYDAEGNVSAVIDTSDRTRTIGYDRLNRQVSETVPGTSSAITDSYDGAGDLITYKDGSDSTITYGYDAANELTSIIDAAGTFHLQNDNDGNRLQITEPNGVTLYNTYTASNQVKTVSTSASGSGLPLTSTYAYTPTGSTTEQDQLQELSIGTSTHTYYGYGTNDALCWVGTSTFSSCTSTTGRTYNYQYDLNLDLTSATNTSGSTYYGFRDNGELCYSGSTSGTDVSSSCPTTPSGDTTYTNDNAGNLTGTSTHTGSITYNTGNQATSLAPLATGSPTVTMTYDDHGNQLRTAAGSDTLDNGPLGVTATTNGTNTTDYTRDPSGNLIDERGPSATYYYLTDRNHSVIALIDSTGADAGDYTYTPYGALTNSGSLTTAATANPWRYASGYQDTEGDNDYHFGARYYDPTISRFTQPDSVTGSIATPQTVNLYAYAGADPINNSDPSGHDFLGTLEDIGAAIGVVTAAIALVTLAPEATLLEGTVAALNFATSAGFATYTYGNDLAE